jgi:hypothetical protein
MAYTPIYTPKNFTDWGPPDLDASNLNDIEAALVSLGNGLQTAAADTDANTAAITTPHDQLSPLFLQHQKLISQISTGLY